MATVTCGGVLVREIEGVCDLTNKPQRFFN